MEETISAADANRNFSRILRDVRQGRSYIVTSHGRPVASVSPAVVPDHASVVARRVLLRKLRQQPVRRIGRWKREELYEDHA